MDRSSLKSFIRAKGRSTDSSIKLSKDLHELTIEDPQGKDPEISFDFYRVFVESSQEEVFEISGRPIVEHVMDGFDGMIILYGPSNTGKSYTMIGKELDKGLFLHSIQTFLEESTKVSMQKDISIIASIVELFGNHIRDLGLAHKDPHAINVFPTQQLEICETNSRVYIGNVSEILISSVEDAVSLITAVNDMRAALEAKIGKYVDKAHTVISVKLKQKYKGAAWDQFSESIMYFVELPGSEKPKHRKGQDFYDSLSASSSFHAISKCLTNLNSISNHFSDHKITRMTENAFKNNSQISIIGTINIEVQFNEESIRTLSYIDKCKTSTANINFTDNNSDFAIKVLQDERAVLKEKLKKVEIVQDEQLKRIVKVLGIEYDIDSLLQAQQGSKELQHIAQQREAVGKIDALMRKNKEIEKRVEENKKVFEKYKKIDFQRQEQHLRQVLEAKDELNRLKDHLETTKAAHDFSLKTQIQTKTIELNEMLENSQKLLNEKHQIMSRLPREYTSTISLPSAQDVKDLAKTEIIKEYTQQLSVQDRNNIKHFQITAKKYETQLEQRDEALAKIRQDYEKAKLEKETELEALQKEMKMLFETIKAQKKVICGIQNGEYNQHLGVVEYPEGIFPDFPDEKIFPK